METIEQSSLLNKNSAEAGIVVDDMEEPKFRFNEQEMNQQIINLEEDLAACFLERLAIIL